MQGLFFSASTKVIFLLKIILDIRRKVKYNKITEGTKKSKTMKGR